jgi:hypothetical protein
MVKKLSEPTSDNAGTTADKSVNAFIEKCRNSTARMREFTVPSGHLFPNLGEAPTHYHQAAMTTNNKRKCRATIKKIAYTHEGVTNILIQAIPVKSSVHGHPVVHPIHSQTTG